MRQLFLDKGSLVVKKVAEPLLHDTTVLVAVHYSCSDADIDEAFLGQNQSDFFQSVPGKVKRVLSCISSYGDQRARSIRKNEMQGDLKQLGGSCSGRVIAIGRQVKNIRVGDLVACAGDLFAQHADIVAIPEHLLVRLHDKKRLKAASLTAIGASALYIVRRATVQLGERVCIFGLDLMGQLVAQLAKCSGCTVICCDTNRARLDVARAMGVDYVYHLQETDIEQEVAVITERFGVDASFITATGGEGDLFAPYAVAVTRKNGRIVLMDTPSSTSPYQSVLQKKDIDLLICSGFSSEDVQSSDASFQQQNMRTIVELLESGQLMVEPLLAHEVSFDDLKGLRKAAQKADNVCLLIRYAPDQAEESWAKNKKTCDIIADDFRYVPAKKNKTLRLGVIGAGKFCKLTLLPLIHDMESVAVKAVVDLNGTDALNTARLHNIPHVFSDEDELFRNDIVDAVLIASADALHAQQSLKALHYGKPVLVGKPMITSWQQYEVVKKVIRQTDIPFCVGYNYSFSPFMQKLKKIVADRHTPLCIQYRINTGYVDKERWMVDDAGTGHIISEACSVIDLFSFLTDSRPVAVSVEALHAAQASVFPTDNMSAQISFEDGSICTLLLTSIGHKDIGRDRMELFFDGKSVLMNDYKQLYGFGLPTLFNEVVSVADLGHHDMLTAFFNALRQPNYTSPIPYDRLKIVAELTLLIDQLACAGGGTQPLSSGVTFKQHEL